MNRDELIEETAITMWLAAGYDLNADPGSSTDRELRPMYMSTATKVIDAVLPLIEADVRERIATEIEAIADPLKDNGSKADRYQRIGMQAAARIARGADR